MYTALVFLFWCNLTKTMPFYVTGFALASAKRKRLEFRIHEQKHETQPTILICSGNVLNDTSFSRHINIVRYPFPWNPRPFSWTVFILGTFCKVVVIWLFLVKPRHVTKCKIPNSCFLIKTIMRSIITSTEACHMCSLAKNVLEAYRPYCDKNEPDPSMCISTK